MALFIRETLILFDVPLNTFILFPEPSEICHKASWDWASAEEWITGVMLWSLTGSPPEAKDMDCMWWLAIICGNRKERHSSAVKHFISSQRRDSERVCFCTCLESGVIRFKLLVEMLRLILIPANCRLLLPKILERSFEGGWKRERNTQTILLNCFLTS